MDIKKRRGRCSEYSSETAKYVAGEKPWGEVCDIALPCATQNKILEGDAQVTCFCLWFVHLLRFREFSIGVLQNLLDLAAG
jgi:hypothetical protein